MAMKNKTESVSSEGNGPMDGLELLLIRLTQDVLAAVRGAKTAIDDLKPALEDAREMVTTGAIPEHVKQALVKDGKMAQKASKGLKDSLEPLAEAPRVPAMKPLRKVASTVRTAADVLSAAADAAVRIGEADEMPASAGRRLERAIGQVDGAGRILTALEEQDVEKAEAEAAMAANTFFFRIANAAIVRGLGRALRETWNYIKDVVKTVARPLVSLVRVIGKGIDTLADTESESLVAQAASYPAWGVRWVYRIPGNVWGWAKDRYQGIETRRQLWAVRVLMAICLLFPLVGVAMFGVSFVNLSGPKVSQVASVASIKELAATTTPGEPAADDNAASGSSEPVKTRTKATSAPSKDKPPVVSRWDFLPDWRI